MHNRILYRLTWLALAMSLGHHLDHLVRGNAVSWPLTGQVNAFTFSLGVYPVIATRLGAVPCRPGRARVLGRGLRRRRRLRQRRALRPLGGRTPEMVLVLTPTTRRSWAGWRLPGWWPSWPCWPSPACTRPGYGGSNARPGTPPSRRRAPGPSGDRPPPAAGRPAVQPNPAVPPRPLGWAVPGCSSVVIGRQGRRVPPRAGTTGTAPSPPATACTPGPDGR
jgi:hypothetical protein